MSEITRTVFLDDGDEKLELRKYTLEVKEGANAGARKTFEGRQTAFGTSPDNDPLPSF